MILFPDIQLPELVPSPKVNMRLKILLMEVAQKHTVSVWEMRTETREAYVVRARADFARNAIEFSSPTEIAQEINKDRTTIYHYLNDYV